MVATSATSKMASALEIPRHLARTILKMEDGGTKIQPRECSGDPEHYESFATTKCNYVRAKHDILTTSRLWTPNSD